MIVITIAGGLGKDAEAKTTQDGKQFCAFSLAGSVGYGERKETIWFDVTKWGNGSHGLAGMLQKGAKVTVSGELSTREHSGKTYLQVRADHVALQGGRGEQSSTRHRNQDGFGTDNPPSRDLDDDVPF